jgi:prephenate dehydrogenase
MVKRGLIAMAGMQITVVGAAGKMGTLFTKYFLKQRHKVFVHDMNKASLRRLTRMGAKIVGDLKFTIMNSDAVILCVPINATKRVMLRVSKYMMIDSTLIEISSIKHEAHKTLIEVARLYKLKPLCIHPLFGPGAEGIKGMKIALAPVLNTKTELRNAKKIFKGASFVTVDVDEHDKKIAVVLGLTHLTSAILAKILADERELDSFNDVAGTTYRLQSMLTESIMNDDADLFTSLLISNSYTRRYARSLLKATEQMCKYVMNDNPRGLSNTYVRIQEKLGRKVNLEKSYQEMYEVLKTLKR